MSGHVLPAKMSASVAAYLAVLWLLGPPRLAQSFVHVIPAMSTASTYTPKRLERTDDRPTPFLTASTSGSTIESALGSLGTVVRREMGECPHLHRGRPRCGIAVLFYSGVDTPCDGCGIQDALAGFHGCLPFVDQIIASPARATSASQHGDEERRTKPGFTTSVTLINNPDVKVDTFVLPPAPDRSYSSSLLREADIRGNVIRALERSTAPPEARPSSYPTPSEPDQFETICLAFGADVDAGKEVGGIHGDEGNPCVSQLHRLNRLLREGGSRVGGGGASLQQCPRANRCPLVASVTSAMGGVFVSRRDEETDECSAVTGGVVGAILSGGRDSSASFQLAHAGKHAALRGSQFRIRRMEDGKIVEVMPVLPMEGHSSSSVAAADRADDPSNWPRPRCDGAVSAAEWCKHAVAFSTRFEKMAMQSALGVGVLKRMGVDDQHLVDDGGSMSGNVSMRAVPAPVGVIPCLPAQSCFDIEEVELDGSLRVSQGAPPTGELRVGDLCDFRAVGPLAAMQAEQDAYSWLHTSRISAAFRSGWDDDSSQKCGASRAPVVQGCLVASAGARFAGGFEQEGCHDVVSAASGHGGCPTVGIVSDLQLVSVDNTMATCSSNTGFAGVYVCGNEQGPE